MNSFFLVLTLLLLGCSKGQGADDVKEEIKQISAPTDVKPINVPDTTPSPVNPIVLPDVPAGSCVKAGHFNKVWFKTEYTTNENPLFVPVTIARFTSDSVCEQEFYLETGIMEQSFKQFAVIGDIGLQRDRKAIRSACDSNIHYAGTKVKLTPKQSVNVYFYPRFYTTNLNTPRYGFYDVVVGAYSGCMNAGNLNNNFILQDYVRNVRYSGNLEGHAANTWQEVTGN